jgi:predicted phosphodiesterase
MNLNINIHLNTSLFIFLFCAIVENLSAQSASAPVRIGIFTDCQYCDCPTTGVRNYRSSLQKIDSAIMYFNLSQPDAVFHLGDMIDRRLGSYDSVLPRFNETVSPLHLVLGNHDQMVGKKNKGLVDKKIGKSDWYYRLDFRGWTFLVLNGNDLSYYLLQTKEQRRERNEMVAALWGSLRFSGMPWNGGIGSTQLQWLSSELKSADSAGKNVLVICHFPLFAPGNHTLFDNREVFSLISRHRCVKAYFCGHYHAGNYQERDGIHLVNFKGMVDTPVNAFAMVTLTSDSILINGYGREPDRWLRIRR